MEPSDSPEFLGHTHSSLHQPWKTCTSSVLIANSIFFRICFLSSNLNRNTLFSSLPPSLSLLLFLSPIISLSPLPLSVSPLSLSFSFCLPYLPLSPSLSLSVSLHLALPLSLSVSLHLPLSSPSLFPFPLSFPPSPCLTKGSHLDSLILPTRKDSCSLVWTLSTSGE